MGGNHRNDWKAVPAAIVNPDIMQSCRLVLHSYMYGALSLGAYCVLTTRWWLVQDGLSVLRGTQPVEHLYLAASEDCYTDDICHVPALNAGKPLCICQLALCDDVTALCCVVRV